MSKTQIIIPHPNFFQNSSQQNYYLQSQTGQTISNIETDQYENSLHNNGSQVSEQSQAHETLDLDPVECLICGPGSNCNTHLCSVCNGYCVRPMYGPYSMDLPGRECSCRNRQILYECSPGGTIWDGNAQCCCWDCTVGHSQYDYQENDENSSELYFDQIDSDDKIKHDMFDPED